MTPAPSLPPLSLLRDLFSYNPVTGAISYLQQRGPRSPGEPAGATVRGVPRLYVNGAYCRAAAVAWALSHGRDPAPQHVVPADGDPMNLKSYNLQLSDAPYKRCNISTGKRKDLPVWLKRCVRYSKTQGVWLAFHKRQLLGEFSSRQEAVTAKFDAIQAQEEMKMLEQECAEEVEASGDEDA